LVNAKREMAKVAVYEKPYVTENLLKIDRRHQSRHLLLPNGCQVPIDKTALPGIPDVATERKEVSRSI
jgi:hypothetical protein